MHIAIDARYLNETQSGVAKYSENLINHLSQQDQENRYTVFIHRSFNRRLKVGENFHIIESAYHPVSIRTLINFGNMVKKTECHFLHSLSPVAPLYGAPKQILTLHDLQPFIVDEEEESAKGPSRGKLASLFYKLSFPHAVRATTWFISVSRATKDRFVRHFPEMEHKTITVHSGVEKIYFEPPEGTIAQMVAKKMGLPPRFILYIGNARPQKNLPTMIRVFKKALQAHINKLEGMEFVLALSHDRNTARIRKLVHEEGMDKQVRFVGPVTEEEKRVLYARATLLFFASKGEGFGFPIVEAQAAGLPVLGSNDASMPEIAGNSAMLVPPNDEHRLEESLAQLLLDEQLRKDYAEKGRKNAERFSWTKTADEVLQIYKLLM
ncbi:MAG: glycosyltransferase family 4 protein [Candidatus Sumerlaeia bacterium]